MGVFAFFLPVVCMGIGLYLGVNLAARQRYRALGLLLLLCAGGFWASTQFAQSGPMEGSTGVGAAIVAFLVILPAASGLLAGLVAGWLRRRRLSGTDG